MKMENDKVFVEYMPAESLEKWERNPKLHDVESIISSIAKSGFVAPVIIDETTGKIVAGHGRVTAIRRMESMEYDLPKRVVDGPNGWEIPVVRNVDFETLRDAEIYLLADNKTGMAGGIDDEMVAAILADIDDVESRRATGYSESEIEILMAESSASLNPEQLDDKFELKSGERDTFKTMSFVLAEEQCERIAASLDRVRELDVFSTLDTFGNPNKNGNAIAAIVELWEAQNKLS